MASLFTLIAGQPTIFPKISGTAPPGDCGVRFGAAFNALIGNPVLPFAGQNCTLCPPKEGHVNGLFLQLPTTMSPVGSFVPSFRPDEGGVQSLPDTPRKTFAPAALLRQANFQASCLA